ncbi:UNVERIFIED_CONTAM: hypothetical protein RMT77_006377 [Armadillidium vulgare]|uniref:Pigment-dispersing hormone peptides n=1 Tax=Armadillidium vulgare TaxID=13347 RepID=PDH_ARMVU|nr:RecName: Full=Pigment-dispersing hormone peptides; Short=AvPDH; Contains: RecName: Full=PDH precursor-related peptide; Short=PPRP; Contains: RecName: Full=Pigment-dispersing hormone; Short=PDH; Flags: Precursor [Armadillidium vulgare]RXG67145.1 Pigment-dispersing hormone peptide [Armadillidium vulgare]BAI67599.1 pigment-dispersing hormone [Armadillidium vulgare]
MIGKYLSWFMLAFLFGFVLESYRVQSQDLNPTEKEVLSNMLDFLQRHSRTTYMFPLLSESKRNSELINSLLGAPRVLNNAGR